MNPIETIQADLTKRFPELRIEIDPPANPLGHWFMDVWRAGEQPPIIVEWRPELGFGVSTTVEGDYGSGPDEIYDDAQSTYERVRRLILSNGKTQPPEAIRLRELRQILDVSQEELAGRIGVKQANISRIESRDDIKVSTLAKIVNAMGATLSIRARFPDGVERELEI